MCVCVCVFVCVRPDELRAYVSGKLRGKVHKAQERVAVALAISELPYHLNPALHRSLQLCVRGIVQIR